ncbi:hypothetical protein DFH27DRAFT_649911 [Peziza echinospora]|nr:hypothetical protein DFH27DRAFT_649911 [Peziza echinospora]
MIEEDTVLIQGYAAVPTCCTCASALLNRSETNTHLGNENRQTDCCHRFICAKCIDGNPRFKNYCPFCQTSTEEPLKCYGALPPAYSPGVPLAEETISGSQIDRDAPPRYDSAIEEVSPFSTEGAVIHYLQPGDTLDTLALQYNVSRYVLQARNNIFSDRILQTRHAIYVPRSHYQGPSLAPFPSTAIANDPRLTPSKQQSIRNFEFKTTCKEHMISKWYLADSNWDEDLAIFKWRLDDEWERNNPDPVGLKEGKRGRRRSVHRASDIDVGAAEKTIPHKARRWTWVGFL